MNVNVACITSSCRILDMLTVSFIFFFKQKTAYEMRISDWSSDVCSSDLLDEPAATRDPGAARPAVRGRRASVRGARPAGRRPDRARPRTRTRQGARKSDV